MFAICNSKGPYSYHGLAQDDEGHALSETKISVYRAGWLSDKSLVEEFVTDTSGHFTFHFEPKASWLNKNEKLIFIIDHGDELGFGETVVKTSALVKEGFNLVFDHLNR